LPNRLREAAARGGHDLVYASQVFFNSASTCGDIAALAASVPDRETLVVIDGYHGFMAVPTNLSAVARRVFYIAGGYKYAMSGEGACFMHCPPGYAPRPRDTGWFAAFGALSARQSGVPYGTDGSRFLGATFDPTGLYRMRAVFDWIDEIGLTVQAIHAHALALEQHFLMRAEASPFREFKTARLATPIEDPRRGHFLTFETPRADAIYRDLLARRIVTDVRGHRLRFGFGCYHRPADIDRAFDRLEHGALLSA
jgi:kynureninase